MEHSLPDIISETVLKDITRLHEIMNILAPLAHELDEKFNIRILIDDKDFKI
jgi:hypothetical protein